MHVRYLSPQAPSYLASATTSARHGPLDLTVAVVAWFHTRRTTVWPGSIQEGHRSEHSLRECCADLAPSPSVFTLRLWSESSESMGEKNQSAVLCMSLRHTWIAFSECFCWNPIVIKYSTDSGRTWAARKESFLEVYDESMKRKLI